MRRSDPAAMPDDRPAALVASGPHGIVVTAVNGPASSSGIRAGMALSDARAALPSLLAHAAEPARDRALLMRLARWAGRYGPSRNRQGADGLWIDITGVAHLFGGEAALLRDLELRLRASGLTAMLGLAETGGAAWALARYGPDRQRGGTIAPQGAVRRVLAALPVEALRLDPGTVVLMRRLGLYRIGQLYGLPRAALERRFRSRRDAAARGAVAREAAAAVLLRLDQALGLAREPLRPLGEPPVLSVRRTYPEPLVSAAWLAGETEGLVAELVAALAAAHLGARRLRLSLHRADGSVAEARVGASLACRDGAHIVRLLQEKLAQLDAGLGIDVLVLDADSVERLGAHQAAIAAANDREGRSDPAPLVDRLVNRLGSDRVLRLAARQSHIPERAQIPIPALSGHAPRTASHFGTLAKPWRRPPLLLSMPERITVMAELPEGPPARFTWRRVLRTVRKAEGPERIAPEWWRELHLMVPAAEISEKEREPDADHAPADEPADAPAPSRPRDYYRLEDMEGARYWVFRDGLYTALAETGTPHWYVHGIFA